MGDPVSTPRSDEALRITGDKLRFYLERRKQIEEWADLSSLEPPEASTFLSSLQLRITAAAQSLDQDTIVTGLDLGGQKMIALSHSRWPTASEDQLGPERPVALIGLAWIRAAVRFEGPKDTAWLGLRVELRDDLLDRNDLLARLPSSHLLPNRRRKEVWMLWGWASCNYGAYWDDLDPYATSLVEHLLEVWELLAPTVDQAFP